MNRKEYTDAVLTALRHVTDRERLAIRAELDAHIEDHIAALRELDYPPELAEERALAAMGDPTEVGRSSMFRRSRSPQMRTSLRKSTSGRIIRIFCGTGSIMRFPSMRPG